MAAPFRHRFPLSVSSAQDPGFPDPRAEADRIARVLRARPSWCPDQAKPRSRSGPTSPPLPSSVGTTGPATARTSGGQDTYSGPWNARTSPILEVGNPAGPFIPLRDAIAMPCQFANVRLLTVNRVLSA
jgi:hypothetical protein